VIGGAVVWFTGPPAAGKSTLARRTMRLLRKKGECCALLDGDDVRAALFPRPGYKARQRLAFYRTLAGLAAMLAKQGILVLVSATAHRRSYRQYARSLAPQFFEVYVSASPELCAERDRKGLYALASAGRAPQLPGARLAYQAPLAPDVVAQGGRDPRSPKEILDKLAQRLR
jgi:adenylylsulfate kinase